MSASEQQRKCAKCHIAAANDDSVNLCFHRFPLPGKHGSLKARVWAEFCYPAGNWSTEKSLRSLHLQHKMLCSKHFDDTSYTSNSRKRLNNFAIPIGSESIMLKLRQELSSTSSDTSTNPTIPDVELQVVFSARGVMPPVFTPLNDDLTVNYSAIPSYAKFLADSGIKSVLVGGTTGEHMSLSVDDRKKIIDVWVKAGKCTGLHIMVQVGGAPMADVVALAQYCQDAGVDSLLTLPELYFKPVSVQELVSYVGVVAKAAPKLPVLYYHIPAWSKVEINMPAFVTAATSQIPNFKGIKFTSNDLSEGAQVLRALKEGQEIFLGADTLVAPAALLGIKSSIGTSFNLFPKAAAEILDAVESNDILRARKLQEKLSLAIEALTSEGLWVPVMKAGMEIVTGFKMGPPVLPQKPISTEAYIRLQGKLKALGF